MLSEFPVTPTLPIVDVARAKKFYSEKLGLKMVQEHPAGIRYACGKGTSIWLYPRSTATTSDATSFRFEVKDVVKEVADLKKKGVMFEEYDMPGLKTVNNIVTDGNVKGAWFKDSEGNIIAITQGM